MQTPSGSGGTRRGEKDELTSCRGTVQSAWQKPPVRRKGGRAGLPKRVSGRHVVRGRQSSPTLEVRLGEQARQVNTVKIQVRWAACSPWRRPSAPECGDALKVLAGDQRPFLGGDLPRRRLRGRYRLGHRSVVLLST